MNQINRNMNNIQIIFEDTVDSENNSNFLNCSVDSRPRSSPRQDDIDNDSDSGNGASNCASPNANNLNLAAAQSEPKPKPKPLRSHATNRPIVPNVASVAQVYEQRQKMRMQQIERIEREQRKFHARKVPNFSLIHAAQGAKLAAEEPKSTIPVTPKVVHHHRENLIRVRAKVSSVYASKRKTSNFIHFIRNQLINGEYKLFLNLNKRCERRKRHDSQNHLWPEGQKF